MALKLALISFELEHREIYNLNLDLLPDQTGDTLKPQPFVKKCADTLSECLQQVIGVFKLGNRNVYALDNTLSLAIISISQYRTGYIEQAQHAKPNSEGSSNVNAIIKFYKYEGVERYKVCMDIEQLWNTNDTTAAACYKPGLSNSDITKLVTVIKRAFKLEQIESIPLIKRGRLDKPHYLVSSDERVLEYDFDSVVMNARSEYQDVKIVHSPSLGNTLLLDNLQNLAENDLPYTHGLMDFGQVDYHNKEILILGGGDGGLLHELLKESPKMVTMIDIDELVITACRDHLKPCGETMRELEGSNYKIIVGDCLAYLKQYAEQRRKFDIIFNDLTDIPVTKRSDSLSAFTSSFCGDNPWSFIEVIFMLSLRCLSDTGAYMNHATGSGNVEAIKAYEELLGVCPIKVKFQRRSRFVPSFMEDWVFYTITKDIGN